MNRKSRVVWRRRLDFGLTAIMLGMTALSLWVFRGLLNAGSPKRSQEIALPAGPVPVDGLLARGSPDAAAAVIVFADFQCPFCVKFARDEMTALLQEADKGSALVQFANYPIDAIHPMAHASAESQECAKDEGLGWQLHDQLFRLSGSSGLRTKSDLELAIAASTPKDTVRDRMRHCVDSQKNKPRIAAQIALGKMLGVRGTPTFVLGRQNGGAFFPRKRIVGTTAAKEISDELRQISRGQ